MGELHPHLSDPEKHRDRRLNPLKSLWIDLKITQNTKSQAKGFRWAILIQKLSLLFLSSSRERFPHTNHYKKWNFFIEQTGMPLFSQANTGELGSRYDHSVKIRDTFALTDSWELTKFLKLSKVKHYVIISDTIAVVTIWMQPITKVLWSVIKQPIERPRFKHIPQPRLDSEPGSTFLSARAECFPKKIRYSKFETLQF